jgi:hypothetical protein
MPQCQFPIFCYFCVSKKLHRKYSQNWTKQKSNLLIFTEASRRPKRRRMGATGQPHQGVAWPSPGPRPLVVRSPGPPPDATLLPIYSSQWEKPKDPINFPETHCDLLPSLTRDREGPELFSAPCRRGQSPPEVFFIAKIASGIMSE